MITVFPVADRLVRDPSTLRAVPDDGLAVSEHDVFWAARLRDGDVTVDAPKTTKGKE